MSADTVPAGALELLHAELSSEQGPLADALRPPAAVCGQDPFATLVERGSRTQPDELAYGVIVESILEGYLLHYGSPRLLDTNDADLRLLAGDHLYAFGLARLARIGDLEAVDELADLISLCAQAHSEGTGARLTRALWLLAALAVRDGGWREAGRAKRAAREQGGAAVEFALRAASERAEQLGVHLEAERALIAFDRLVSS